MSKSPREVSRRQTLVLGAGALAAVAIGPGRAQADTARHGMSAFGDLKYPADFKHFDYVDPNARKGGMFSHVGSTRAYNQNFLTFNSLNSFILKGDGAQGMELTFASLMVRAQDEPDGMYGLAARAVEISEDGLGCRFLMRTGTRFHDGSPLTAHDVAFSLNVLKEKGHPIAHQLLRDFVGAEATDDATVVVRFAPQATFSEINNFLGAHKATVVEGPVKAGSMYRIRLSETKLNADEVGKIIREMQSESRIVGFVAVAPPQQ